ncbi:MAG: long-chain acyl-CoA thioesterase FadM [Bdellovibrio sp.]
MSVTYEYPVTILERHLDTFGHVNNATYLELYEEARWDFITQNGYDFARIQREKVGPIILDLNLTFKRELLNREKIVIKSQYQGMKNKYIMTLNQWMMKEDGKIASTLELSVALMDMKERKMVEPIADWMNAIGAN